jgi:hypothetical protein
MLPPFQSNLKKEPQGNLVEGFSVLKKTENPGHGKNALRLDNPQLNPHLFGFIRMKGTCTTTRR